MKYRILFLIFTGPYLSGSAVFLEQNKHSVLICSQGSTSLRHVFLKNFFARKMPIKTEKVYPYGENWKYCNHWKYYDCSEEEIKLLRLIKKIPENSKLWCELQWRLSQNYDLAELIRLLEICVLVESFSK